jgi:hypothetical protein
MVHSIKHENFIRNHNEEKENTFFKRTFPAYNATNYK